MDIKLSEKRSNANFDDYALEYVSPVDHSLLCPICQSPFVDPVQILRCDHSFCRKCLLQSFKISTSEADTCPTCRNPVIASDSIIGVPRFVHHVLDELIVKCPHSVDGCGINVMRSQVQDHISFYCDFAEIPCPSRYCTLSVPRFQLGHRCLHTMAVCEDCSNEIVERDLEKHRETSCTKRLTACCHCSTSVMHHALQTHMRQCAEAVQSCRASSLGCAFKGKKLALPDHESTCSLSLIWPSITAMTRRLDGQAQAMALVSSKCNKLENVLGSVESAINLLQSDGQSGSGDSVSNKVSSIDYLDQRPLSNSDVSAPFESVTHHLLSLYENLRGDIDRTTSAVSEMDARLSLMLLNENLRLKEDMAHTNAVIGSIRAQLQWLTSARLQAEQRNLGSADPPSLESNSRPKETEASPSFGPIPSQRLSDPPKQDTKL